MYFGFFLLMVLNRVLKQLSLFEEGKGREGAGGGGITKLSELVVK